MASLVLSVIGDDRPGLVSTVSRLVEVRGGSWQRSQMARLAGKFAGVALVEVPDGEVALLEEELAGLAVDGLQVRVERAGPRDGGGGGDESEVRLHLLGQDRPGIVAEISAALAAHQIGIDELVTDVRDAPMAGGSLFEVEASLSVPAATDLAEVRGALEQLADELMVELSLEPTPSA
ncbi:glycine cleavage system protein R [Nocardioides sp.]|uniref:glycine cleavage system protein R n=1 Tax=Nocardioides sp. TaxID=35761 RepID=UPI002B2776CA|nr:ACT domain-containing protein [Nocardioides sp.]